MFATRLLLRSVVTLSLLMTFGAIATQAGAGAPAPATTELPFAIYLPIAGNGAASQPPPPPPSSTPFVRWAPDFSDDGKPVATYRMSLAVDHDGGLHAAYARYGGADRQSPAIYSYCPSACEQADHWSRIHLGQSVSDAEVQLDPQGHPRLMLFGSADDPQNENRMLYTYASCDASCSNASSWALTPIAGPIEPVSTRSLYNNHYFALDPQGHPAFVYTDTSNNNHPGTWYTFCASDPSGCSDAASWSETQLGPNLLGNSSLVFTPQGQPRVMFDIYNSDSQTNQVWYAACDTGCGASQSWAAQRVWDMHGSGRVQLRVDPQGRPRAIFYSGNYASAPFAAGQLYYVWCDIDCASGPWRFNSLGLPQLSGSEVDLALDAQGRPRIAFANHNQGLSYAWCNQGCQDSQPQWQAIEVEAYQSLANDFEVLPIRKCTVSTWFNGSRPWLALDSAGNPRIGYDAQHVWYGVELTGGGARTCDIQDITVTRVAAFDQP